MVGHRAETFDVLGFTHIRGQRRQGDFSVVRQVARVRSGR